jgi:hypothetical protein
MRAAPPSPPLAIRWKGETQRKSNYSSCCKWISQGFGVLCRETATGTGMGIVTYVGLMGYDAGAESYALCQVNNMGKTWIFHGTAEGDT